MAREKRSIDERIAELQEKQKQLKQQEKILKAKRSAEERKIRTKHLIEIGGAVYKVLEREYQDGDIERLITFLNMQNQRGQYFNKAMNNH